MVDSTLLLTLPQVIDAAFTGPEIGTVSFGLLNNILQVMCQQMNLENLKVQYKGTQAKQIEKIFDPKVKSNIPGVSGVKKTGLPTKAGGEKMVIIPDRPSEAFPAMTLVISETQIHDMNKNIKALQQDIADLKDLPANSEIFKALKGKPGESTPLLDMYKILTITKRVDASEQTILKIATFVEDLAKYVQTKELPSEKPQTESQMTLGSKVGPAHWKSTQATSDDISDIKFPSLADLSDMKTSTPKRLKSGPSGIEMSSRTSSPDTTEPRTQGTRFSISDPSETRKRGSILTDAKTSSQYSSKIGALHIKQAPHMSSISEGLSHPASPEEQPSGQRRFTAEGSDISEIEGLSVAEEFLEVPRTKLDDVRIANMSNLDALNLVQEELSNMRTVVKGLAKAVFKLAFTPSQHKSSSTQSSGTDENVKTMDPNLVNTINLNTLKVNQCIKQMNKMDSIFSHSYTTILSRTEELEATVKFLSDRAVNEFGKADIEELLSLNVYKMTEKITQLEDLTSKMSDALNILVQENESQNNKIADLIEDVDYMKVNKVDREEFQDALNEKVDLCMINRKVSHEQFNATCDDLSRGIEEALEKLMEQEDLWHTALKEIQGEINSKLDKDDLAPLKVFVTDKLKGLKQRVATLSKLKREQEAAATKSKFLTNVQCISCDKDVVMRKKLDTTMNYPMRPGLQTQKSMAPYLAYELDQLRKQQHHMAYSRNLHHFESATDEKKRIVNRYCGGTHTITTPQQRVTRLGNFVDQWGPQALPMEENEISKDIGGGSKPEEKKAKLSVSATRKLSKESLARSKEIPMNSTLLAEIVTVEIDHAERDYSKFPAKISITNDTSPPETPYPRKSSSTGQL